MSIRSIGHNRKFKITSLLPVSTQRHSQTETELLFLAFQSTFPDAGYQARSASTNESV